MNSVLPTEWHEVIVIRVGVPGSNTKKISGDSAPIRSVAPSVVPLSSTYPLPVLSHVYEMVGDKVG